MRSSIVGQHPRLRSRCSRWNLYVFVHWFFFVFLVAGVECRRRGPPHRLDPHGICSCRACPCRRCIPIVKGNHSHARRRRGGGSIDMVMMMMSCVRVLLIVVLWINHGWSCGFEPTTQSIFIGSIIQRMRSRARGCCSYPSRVWSSCQTICCCCCNAGSRIQ